MFEILAIVVIILAGGCLPLLVEWSDRWLHLALAGSTGIFLGATFLHLLPEIANVHVGEAAASHAASHGDATLWVFVLIGVLAVYLFEAIVFRAGDADRHTSVGYAAAFGLSIHSLLTGIGYSAAKEIAELVRPVLIAILAHKGFEAFSLASVFRLAGFSRTRILVSIAAFSLITPAGILLGGLFTRHLGEFGIAVVAALAAGTFLYVCLCELLPEVFHHREDGIRKILVLFAGVALMLALHDAGV
jgi:zinc transporter ZupT